VHCKGGGRVSNKDFIEAGGGNTGRTGDLVGAESRRKGKIRGASSHTEKREKETTAEESKKKKEKAVRQPLWKTGADWGDHQEMQQRKPQVPGRGPGKKRPADPGRPHVKPRAEGGESWSGKPRAGSGVGKFVQLARGGRKQRQNDPSHPCGPQVPPLLTSETGKGPMETQQENCLPVGRIIEKLQKQPYRSPRPVQYGESQKIVSFQSEAKKVKSNSL